jgi:hypothetical protein
LADQRNAVRHGGPAADARGCPAFLRAGDIVRIGSPKTTMTSAAV